MNSPLILLSIFLTGCLAVTRGIIKNQSENPVVIYSAGNYQGGAYKIAINNKQEMYWSRGCIVVVENEKLYYFDGSEIPDGYLNIHMFSTSINLVYKDTILFYQGESGKTVRLPVMESCKSDNN